MIYVTEEIVTDLLPGWNAGGDVAKTHKAIMQANAWLSARHSGRILPIYQLPADIPDEILQAGAELAALAFDGKLFTGRTEGVVKSKSVQAGSVSSSKTYVDGDAGQPVSAEIQYVMALIEPYLMAGFAINTFAMRG